MGRRSLVNVRRRQRRLRDQLTLEFCRLSAVFAKTRACEGLGKASTIEWLSLHRQMSEKDAECCVAIGETILKAHRYASDQGAVG